MVSLEGSESFPSCFYASSLFDWLNFMQTWATLTRMADIRGHVLRNNLLFRVSSYMNNFL